MSHFDAETWSDYVRGTMPESERARMRRHLDTGCTDCSLHVTALEAVRRLAEHDRELSPAPGAVRSVLALFRQRQSASAKLRGGRLQLVFDSWLTPAEVGVRRQPGSVRQLIFMSGELSLDLQLESAGGGDGLRVLGEIVMRESGHRAGAKVSLLAGREVVAETVSGELGEFELAGTGDGPLRLRLELDETFEIELPPG